jgi:hypothetical protein
MICVIYRLKRSLHRYRKGCVHNWAHAQTSGETAHTYAFVYFQLVRKLHSQSHGTLGFPWRDLWNSFSVDFTHVGRRSLQIFWASCFRKFGAELCMCVYDFFMRWDREFCITVARARATSAAHTCTHAHMHTCTHAHMHTCTHALAGHQVMAQALTHVCRTWSPCSHILMLWPSTQRRVPEFVCMYVCTPLDTHTHTRTGKRTPRSARSLKWSKLKQVNV